MLDRVRRSAWSLLRPVTTSYVLVAVVVVVLVEAFVLGYQVPKLLSDAKLHSEVSAAAESYWVQLSEQYPAGVPAGALLGDRGERSEPGTVQTTPNGVTLIVPAVTGTVSSHRALTSLVAISRDGTIIASSAPSRYPPGQRAARDLPAAAAAAAIRAGMLKGTSGGSGYTPYGTVSWTLYGGTLLPELPAGGRVLSKASGWAPTTTFPSPSTSPSCWLASRPWAAGRAPRGPNAWAMRI